jgi:hypothetical protein
MNISNCGIRHGGRSKTRRYTTLSLLTASLTFQAQSQSPTLLWSTNVGASIFAVDAQTNVYANAGGTVIRLNADGVPVQTNTICPIPSIAQRDAAGNFYFAGNFDGTQNFGGITLVGGWTNWPSSGQWTPGYPTHYVAKYAANGTLQWVTSFGQQAETLLRLTDLLVGSDDVFVGHLGRSLTVSLPGAPMVTRLDSGGSLQWTKTVSSPFGATVKLGGLTSSNLCHLQIVDGVSVGRLDLNGNTVGFNTAGTFPMYWNAIEVTNGRPVLDNLARVVFAGKTNNQQLLCKFNLDGSLVWAVNNNNGEQWPLARDASECFYFGSVSNALIKYDANGNELWNANYQKKAIQMVVDSSGIRFVSFADGTIARLAPDESPQPPSVLVAPQTQIVSLGNNATFTVTIGGSPTLYYQWRKDGTNLIGATFTNYTITGVTSNHIGYYDVIVTNVYGSITSTPPVALLVSPSLLSPYVGAVGLWGQEAILTVSAWGSGTLSYQWYKGGQSIGGATNSTLVFPSVQISDAGAYSVVVTSAYGSVTNAPADLVVNPANISIALYAGITIQGTIGYTYGIEYATNLQNVTWLSLTNITLAQPVEIWVDTTVPVVERARRFYRVTGQ